MAGRKPDTDTRAALLEAAWSLFAEVGYEAGSVNGIIERAGLSKGTFYHWFSSKEDLLDAVVEQMLHRATAEVVTAVPGPQAGAVERLAVFLSVARAWRSANAPGFFAVLEALHDPRNERLRAKLRARSDEVSAALLVEIFEQGRQEGTLQVDEPALVAELVLAQSHPVTDLQVRDLLAGDVERVWRRARLYLRWIEGNLGLPAGRLGDPQDAFRGTPNSFRRPR